MTLRVALAFALALVVAAAGRTSAPRAQSPQSVPLVPNLPLGVPAKQIPAWDQLSPACKVPSLTAIRPCLKSFVDYGSLTGAVTLVDRKGGAPQTDAVGEYTDSTIFQIQSMSKPFVSVAIMILVDRGKLPSVDTKVSELDGFRDYPYRDVTIKELLTHTSGMWPVHEDSNGVFWGVVPYYRNRLDREPQTTVRDKSLEFVARHYANPQLYPLGSKTYAYSNVGYLTLGWIIERLSGLPFEQFLMANVIRPLGMKDTFIFPSAASAEQRRRIANVDRRLPDALDVEEYDETRSGWTYPSPEAGLYSTAGDLRRFLILFRDRGGPPGSPRILSEQSAARLVRDQVPSMDFGCDGQAGRALGFYVVRAGGCPNMPGLEPGTIWHAGRFMTFYWYDPVRDEIGVFLEQKVTRRDSKTMNSYLGEREAFMQLLQRARPQ